MTEIPSNILSQYLWYNANVQVDETSIHVFIFHGFPKNILIIFHNFLITMALLKNGMILRENMIYIRILVFNGYN